jgi:hypothetical protein
MVASFGRRYLRGVLSLSQYTSHGVVGLNYLSLLPYISSMAP